MNTESSIHEQVENAIRAELERMNGAQCLSPTSLALAVQMKFEKFQKEKIEPHIKYTSLEHLKQMSRRVLRGKFDPVEAEDNGQDELFSGHLQDRYPIKVGRGADPQYKLRTALSDQEARWNIDRLRKSAKARLEHADAMEAWNDSRGDGEVVGA
jgi:hypothetical protein